MKNIFVGNLDFGATEEAIRSLFEAHGTVERVNLMTDRETGRSSALSSGRRKSMAQMILFGVGAVVVAIISLGVGRLIDAMRSRERVAERLLIDDC